jgi:hypothetical protein
LAERSQNAQSFQWSAAHGARRNAKAVHQEVHGAFWPDEPNLNTLVERRLGPPEEIIAKLRQVDVLVSQGQNMVDAIRQTGVSEVTYYRWRQEFGGAEDRAGDPM